MNALSLSHPATLRPGWYFYCRKIAKGDPSLTVTAIMESMVKKSVVILGAGFGGLRAAMDIAKEMGTLKLLDQYDVVLIDRSDCHLYTPLLYEIAASPVAGRKACTYDISALVKSFSIRFIQGEVAELDLKNGSVRLKNGDGLTANYLVIALGSETNDFGIPGLKENALQLKTIESAIRIHEVISHAFEKGGELKILVGGAGPTGVELAAEIRLWADSAQKEYPGLRVFVSMVEALPHVLHGFDARVIAAATNRLEKLRIPVTLNAKITAVGEREVAIAGADKIPFDVFIWTGGVKTPEILKELPVEKESHGKPVAKGDMEYSSAADLKLAPMIYGIGDSVCFYNPKTKLPAPAVARAAIIEGGIAAHNLVEEIKKAEHPNHTPRLKAYVPSDYPYVIAIGENWAVAKIGLLVFWGWPGEMFKKLIELHYLMSIMSLREAFKAWKKT